MSSQNPRTAFTPLCPYIIPPAQMVSPWLELMVTNGVTGALTVIVALLPVPEVVVPPGVLVTVHVPDAGKPFNTTLPVATEHVG